MDAGLSTKALLHRLVQDAPRQVLQWLEPTGVHKKLAAWLSQELAVVGSAGLARELRELCPVPGATVDDYIPRIITLSTGEKAVLRVRFKDGDPDQAFVQWVAGDSAVAGPEDLNRWASASGRSFSALKPRCMRIWIPSGSAWEPSSKMAGVERGKRTFAAPLAALRRRPSFPMDAGYRVIPVRVDSIYPAYAREYELYSREHPGKAHAESIETLLECEKPGGLYALSQDGIARGIVALRRESSPWFDGWYVVDSFLFDGYRGKKLAVPMHQAAYGQVKLEPDDVVWGTIDAGNAPSIATASALGRIDIGADWWIGSR